MQLSAKTQNACLAMLELALRHSNPQPVCLKTIAAQQNISAQFLVQILLQLKRAGLVQSTRGASGGYRLAKHPSEINLLDIVTSMEGATEPVGTETANRVAQVFAASWSTLVDEHHDRLRELTLESLCSRIGSPAEAMYYI